MEASTHLRSKVQNLPSTKSVAQPIQDPFPLGIKTLTCGYGGAPGRDSKLPILQIHRSMPYVRQRDVTCSWLISGYEWPFAVVSASTRQQAAGDPTISIIHGAPVRS